MNMSRAKIVDCNTREELKGVRMNYVVRWTADETDVRGVLSDAEAAACNGGVPERKFNRAAVISALRDADRTNAAKTNNGNRARGYSTVYVRDNGCPDAKGAWWPVELVETTYRVEIRHDRKWSPAPGDATGWTNRRRAERAARDCVHALDGDAARVIVEQTGEEVYATTYATV